METESVGEPSRVSALERENSRLRAQVERQQQVLLGVRVAAGLDVGDGVSLVNHVTSMAHQTLAARRMLGALEHARCFVSFAFLDNDSGVIVEKESAESVEAACGEAVRLAKAVGLKSP